MANYTKASEDIENLVIDISNELGLINYGIDFEPLFVDKAKEVCKIVRANQLAEYASKREDLVFILCYEDAFDLVDEKTKYMWLRMEMDKVAYDTEKEKMIIGCPQITVPVGFYEKYKGEAVESALLGQYTIAQIEEKKKEEAEQRKALRTKGKRKNQ
jgi:hypothetical protein